MSTENQLWKRFFVRGRVQGVGFRDFVRREATHLGLKGYAKNLDDGRVEVLATGSASQLNELNGRLWQGPMLADVRGVEEQEAAPEHVQGFYVA